MTNTKPDQERVMELMADALGQISRMRTLPNHSANTFTLVAAHTIADKALAEYRKMKGGE